MKAFNSTFLLVIILSFVTTTTCSTLNGKVNEKTQLSIESPADILQKTVQKYKSLKFYKSKGITEYPENTVKQNGPLISTTFDLNYEYPSKMILNWKDSNKDGLNTFLVEGKEVSLQENGKATKAFINIDVGLISVSLNEHTTLFGILDFLTFQESTQNRSVISILKNLQKLEDENVDGNLCYKINGEINGVATEGKAFLIYWIDKKSFIVRRIERLLVLGNDATFKSRSVENYTDIEAR